MDWWGRSLFVRRWGGGRRRVEWGRAGGRGFQADATGKRASATRTGTPKRARRVLVAFSRVGAFAQRRSSAISLPFAGRLDAASRINRITWARVWRVPGSFCSRYLAYESEREREREKSKNKTEVGTWWEARVEIVCSDRWNTETRGPKGKVASGRQRSFRNKEEDDRRGVSPRTPDARPSLEVGVDSGTVDDAWKMRRAVRGEAPASPRAAHVARLRRLPAAALRNSRWVDRIFLEVTCVRYVVVCRCVWIGDLSRMRERDTRTCVSAPMTEGEGETVGPQAAFWDLASGATAATAIRWSGARTVCSLLVVRLARPSETKKRRNVYTTKEPARRSLDVHLVRKRSVADAMNADHRGARPSVTSALVSKIIERKKRNTMERNADYPT